MKSLEIFIVTVHVLSRNEKFNKGVKAQFEENLLLSLVSFVLFFFSPFLFGW